MIRNIILAALGGAIGSALRYSTALMFGHKFTTTMCINIFGSLMIGWIMGAAFKNPEFGKVWSIFLATGICGGFTTFSAFSMENILLIQEGKYITSLLYITISIVFGIIAALTGYRLSI